MQARLKSSKKWTAFPQEFSNQVETVFRENFSEKIGNSKLVIDGRIYPEEITLRVGLNTPGQLKQANFEVSINYKHDEKDAVERIHNCVDAAASMMMDYFENEGDVDFPKTWTEYEFGKNSVFLQYSTVNTDLEAEADKLLGTTDDSMLHEEDTESESDALAHAEVDEELTEDRDSTEADDEDEEVADEDKGPKMFGGGKKKKAKKEDMH